MTTSQRVAIVTGASRGIGRATAIRLAQDFSAVVTVARSAAGLETASEAMRAVGAEALPVAIDLRNTTAADTVVTQTLARFGRIDALINIAGAVPQVDLLTMTDEKWADGLALKFHGARRLAIRAWDALKQSNGSVVFMSGSSAITPKAAFAAVGTINAAISAMAKAFAERGVADGIQVNAVLPGPVMTDRRRSMLEKYAISKGLSFDAAVDSFARETGITRYGTPDDIAGLIAFLLSPPARWMMGATLRMDGGEVKAV